jgi:NTE family protein
VSEGNAVDLVFEGGGVRGIALVGALAVLEERGFAPQNLAGTSAGAIVATLKAAGYNAADIYGIMTGPRFSISNVADRGWEDRLPLIGKPLSVLWDRGIFEGEYILDFLRELLADKGVRTFADLIDLRFADDQRYRYKVRVIASDVTARCLLALPQDAGPAERLGTPPDELEVALAVRMSMSIPIFFEPVRFRNPRTKRDHLIVDGGMLSNFPVWLFDSEGEPPWPTFGLRLVEEDLERPLIPERPGMPGRTTKRSQTIDFLWSLVETMTQAHDRLYIEKANFARTIAIPTLGISGTNFDLSREQVDALYASGRQAAEEFLRTWDFEAYKTEFRSGKVHSRREEIAQDFRGDMRG